MRIPLYLLTLLTLFALQCGRQDYPQLDLHTTPLDGGVDSGDDIVDAANDADVVDPPPLCGEDPLQMAFALQTEVVPVTKSFDIEDYLIMGTCTYHGTPLTTITGDPRLQREVVLVHDDASLSVFQYGIPHNREIPFTEGGSYTIRYRRRNGFESYATGVRVERNTSGLVPLLFIGDAGEYDRAFTEEDAMMEPLAVRVINVDSCAPVDDPACGGEKILRALWFDPSGGQPYPSSVQVKQAGSNVVHILGDEFLVTNVSSYEISPNCPDLPSNYISYMALRPPEGDIPCDRARVHSMLDEEFQPGVLCDEIELCADNQLAETLRELAPALECYEDPYTCGGDLMCVWYTPTNLVGAETYYEVCQASLILPEETDITCRVYFE